MCTGHDLKSNFKFQNRLFYETNLSKIQFSMINFVFTCTWEWSSVIIKTFSVKTSVARADTGTTPSFWHNFRFSWCSFHKLLTFWKANIFWNLNNFVSNSTFLAQWAVEPRIRREDGIFPQEWQSLEWLAASDKWEF